jgi:hypothetical protein
VRSPIQAYLHDIQRGLRWRPVLARRVIAEVADHLAQAAAAEVRAGLTSIEAEEAAVRRFGPAFAVVRRYQQAGATQGRLVMAASCATACAAIWLAFVTFVLPASGPGVLVVWRSLAAVFMGYSVLSIACVVSGANRPVLRWSMGCLSIAAVVLGALHIGSILLGSGSQRHFEGYVLLIGAILFGHGLIASVYLLRSDPDPPAWQPNG